MKKLLVFFLTNLFVSVSPAQLFSDASGESDLFVGTRPFAWLRLNTSDNSVTLGYNRFRTIGEDQPAKGFSFFYGADLKVNVKDGIGKILSDKKLKPGIALNLNLGVYSESFGASGNQLAVYLRPGIGYNQYTYIHNNSNNQPIVDEISKLESRALLIGNYFLNSTKVRSFIKDEKVVNDTIERYWSFGISGGYKRANNSNSLDDVVANILQFGDTTNNVVKSEQGKLGFYEGYNTLPINIDVGYTPRILGQSNIGFNTYLRTEIYKPKNTVDVGVGIFVSKSDEPRSVLGGLAWQLNDVGNHLQKVENTFQRSSIFFYIGYTIGK